MYVYRNQTKLKNLMILYKKINELLGQLAKQWLEKSLPIRMLTNCLHRLKSRHVLRFCV